jgi:hypothetical protein
MPRFSLVYPSHLYSDLATREMVGAVASHECHINMTPAIQSISARSLTAISIMSKLVSLFSGPETSAHSTERPVLAFHALVGDLPRPV